MSQEKSEFSFKRLFIPLTTFKAIHWIVLVGIIVYCNSLFNGFIMDDTWQIVNNSIIHSLTNIPLFFSGSTFDMGEAQVLAGNYYKPLMSLYFSILYTFFGATPFPYHLVQLILHILNAIFVFLLFKKFFTKHLSLFLSLIFLVHPINQEAAIYAADIQDILYFFFGILALLIISNGVQNSKRAITITIFLLMSLLSKETGIVFAPLLLCISYVTKKTVALSARILIIVTSGAYLVFRFFILHLPAQTIAPISSLSILQRLNSMPAIFFYYISTFFYPQKLAVVQIWTVNSIDFQHFYFPLFLDGVFLFLIGMLGFYLYKTDKRRMPLYVFFMGWFVLGILFHIQIIPLDATVSTRWFYFTGVGLLGLIGLAIQCIKHGNINIVRAGYVCAAIILVLLSIRTIVRNSNWVDEYTLYSHDIQVDDNFMLEDDMAGQLIGKGQYKQALNHIEKSISISPGWHNYNILASVYIKLGEKDKAIDAYKKSLHYSDYYLSYENLADSYLLSSNLTLAKKYSEEGLKRFPKDALLWLYYGLSEYKSGNKQTAIAAIQKSLSIDNSNSEMAAALNAIVNNQQINLKP